MLVASGVGFGDAWAVLGQFPEVTGNIQTAIGCGTIKRAGGIAVQVMVGDPVCQGDVIETAADGWIEIRFIDGTVFNLFRDTCVVLSEFPRDANGTLRSALLIVTRGTFAFIAGQLARTGSLTVDTPVGCIRSRAHAGGIGMLTLTALTFSLMKEAQAADPNVAFLDDDSIAYKDLAHGVFELVTKEAIPRHIIVEDPGETVVLTRRGSSVSVSQVANSLARMEELHAAQQETLADYAKGLGPNGSSTPPFGNPQGLLQPINFIQTDTIQPQNQLPPLEFAVFPIPETFLLPPTLVITGIAGQIGVAADNIINVARANAGVEITGTTSGVENGRIVTVTIADGSNVVYSGTATVTNGTWSINLSPTAAKALADGIYTLTADTTNATGHPAEASLSIRVDETPPTIAIHTIAWNNVVNANTASTGFAIIGTTTDAENGQPVTVKIVDSSGHVVDTFATTLTNNTWSVNVSSAEAKLLHDGSYTVTANVSDSAGNPASEATQAITVDETPPTVTWLPGAESGIEGAAIALGTITATANSLPGHSNSLQSLVVSSIPVGAVLTDGANCFVATSGNTSIDVMSWNLSNLKISPPNDTNFILTVTATDQDANTASTSELVTVAPLAPALNPVAAQGNEDTAIALDLGVTARSLSGTNGDALPNSLNTLVVNGIPMGASLSDGTGLPGHSFTATAGDTSHDVASWNLSSLKITPPAEFEGSFTLKIAATERDSEGNISATVTATEVVTVAPVAEQPIASAPEMTLMLDENAKGVAVAGVSVGPQAEDGDDKVSATLTVLHGTLDVGSLTGVTVTGDDSAALTLSGSAAAVNALLAGLTYTPTAEYEGSDTLQLSVTSSDGSNTYPAVATASTAIMVKPVAERPTAKAPATLTLSEDAIGVAVAGVSVGPLAEDPDDTVRATLTVSHGTLDVGSLTGVTVTGDDSGTLTLSGSAAAVNSLLAGLTYMPNDEYRGSDTLHLSVTSSDGSNIYQTPATASTAITLADADDDDPPNTFTAVTSPTKSSGGYGTFTMTAAGAWTSMLDNANSVVQANENDIIIGGFGAYFLTGGNGQDHSVNLSLADSNAAQFDTITDFVSGTDKIDLTALGALDSAILALTPTSTSVPAHAIVWRFDSMANDTIVYVNPTDQTQSIGNSGLLEIHLQGVSTVQSSDFVLAPTAATATVVAAHDPIDPAATTQNDATILTTTTAVVSSDTTIVAATTADVSSDTTVSHSALLADWNWTAQTTKIGDSFDAFGDHIDPIDDAKFGSFDEVRTASTGGVVDDAVTALPSGTSIELQHVAATALMQTSVAFDQTPVLGSADTMKIGHGAVMHSPTLGGADWIVLAGSDRKVIPETSLKNEDHEASVPKDTGSTNGGDTHAHRIDASPDVVLDTGGPKTREGGGNRSIASDADEHARPMHGASVHDLETSSIAQVGSGRTVGTPGDTFHFKNELSAVVDTTELNDIPASKSHHEDAAVTNGPLAISEVGETPGAHGDSFHFKDEVSSSKGSGVSDLAKPDQIPASMNHPQDAVGTPVPSTISDGVQATELPPPAQHADDHGNSVPHHGPSALVAHVQHDLIV